MINDKKIRAMKNVIEIKEAIVKNFLENSFDMALAMSEELFSQYTDIKGEKSMKSYLAYLRRQFNQPKKKVEVEKKDVEAEDNENVSYIYFAVSLEDFENGNVCITNAIKGMTDVSRRGMQHRLNDAGYKSDSRWVIAAAKRGDEIIGYGLNKVEAMNARFVA